MKIRIQGTPDVPPIPPSIIMEPTISALPQSKPKPSSSPNSIPNLLKQEFGNRKFWVELGLGVGCYGVFDSIETPMIPNLVLSTILPMGMTRAWRKWKKK